MVKEQNNFPLAIEPFGSPELLVLFRSLQYISMYQFQWHIYEFYYHIYHLSPNLPSLSVAPSGNSVLQMRVKFLLVYVLKAFGKTSIVIWFHFNMLWFNFDFKQFTAQTNVIEYCNKYHVLAGRPATKPFSLNLIEFCLQITLMRLSLCTCLSQPVCRGQFTLSKETPGQAPSLLQ